MNEESDSPPNSGNQWSPEIIWIAAAFLPTAITAILILSTSKSGGALSERYIWLWLIFSGLYLLSLTFAYAKKTKRSSELVSFSLVMSIGLLSANAFVCQILWFAGCVCSASDLSRINH